MLKKILVLKQNKISQHLEILRAAEFREFLTSPSVVKKVQFSTLRWAGKRARHVFVFGGRCCTEFGREYLLGGHRVGTLREE